MQENHDFWMSRTLQLARNGMGNVAPNPMVGAVLVHPELGLVAEGWHAVFGGPHAEVHCLNQVEQGHNREWWQACTLYVSLEPCSHFGKTPPCSGLIIEKQIGRVVVATTDPNPLVAGKGIQQLRDAGIQVISGILEAEARELNRHFFTRQLKGRPFITLKWAETADGFIARADGSSQWISSPLSRSWVHQLRADHQAIWVGRETLRRDNPRLNVRDWPGKSPIRLVVDREGSLPEDLLVFNDPDAETWVFGKTEIPRKACRWFPLTTPEFELEAFLTQLSEAGIQSVLVEGGTWLLNQILQAGFWDEAIVFQSPVRFLEGIKAPEINGGYLEKSFYMANDRVSVWKNS